MANTFPDFQQIIMHGNIARDLEESETANGNKKVKTAIAMNKPFGRDGASSQFITLNIYNTPANGNLADRMLGIVKKGSRVQIIGRLQQDEKVDEATGKKTYFTFVIVDGFQFIGGRPAEEGSSPRQASATPQASTAQARLPAPVEDDELFAPVAPARPAPPAPANRPASARRQPTTNGNDPF
jgi:single-strand DNA-binding protein